MIPATGHTESAPEKDETVPDAAVTKCETCGELLYVKVEDAYFTRHKVEDYKGGSEEAWTYPSREGKVFAGWYDDDYVTPYTAAEGDAWAKFVDAKVLGVETELRTGTNRESETTDICFITSIDTLKFQCVGFEVSIGEGCYDLMETTAYTSILADGEVSPATPETVFGTAESEYFVLHSIVNVPNSAFTQAISVTPYWTTVDGTTVYGEQENFTIAYASAKKAAVSGTLVKPGETELPDELGMTFSWKDWDIVLEKTVTIEDDGSFELTLPVGEYTFEVKADGYRDICKEITVSEESENVLTVTLMQPLTLKRNWRGTPTLTENDGFATITLAEDGDAGAMYEIGEPEYNVSSWEVSAHISAGATERRGVGVITPQGSVLFFVEDGRAGFYTWGNELRDATDSTVKSAVRDLPDEVKAVITGDAGYTLKAVATAIDGAGTGVVRLYVNDTLVYTFNNTLVRLEDPSDKLDLSSKVLLSIGARGKNATATFSDWYYEVGDAEP